LQGELHADEGEFDLPGGLAIASVAQETPAVDHSALDHVIDGDAALRAIERKLIELEGHSQSDGLALSELHAAFDQVGGYTARARAGELLHGLGFKNAELEQPVRHFSGGWRMRLNLARALMCRSDLLLLDEPTNHLDLDAVLWLEDWLKNYGGTLILISHDRDFLDAIATHIAHLDGRTVSLSTGNLSAFERQYAARLASEQALYDRQQREIRRIQAFVDRFRAKATKARQAQSRLKLLERMEQIAVAHVDAPLRFQFINPPSLPSPLLALNDVATGYGERVVLDRLNLSILPGDRIGLIGANGAGKSTFIKLLAGERAAMRGTVVPAQDLRVGYFAQHQLEQLDMTASPFELLARTDGQAREQALLDYLGGFGFSGERAKLTITHFSGGEKARLVLALLVRMQPHLLLLDEPTNHLDMDMRDSLAVALQEYAGAVVLVSHDRYLLNCVCDRLILVRDGGVAEYQGDLDDYRKRLAADHSPESPTERMEHSAAGRKHQRRRDAEARLRRQPLVSEMKALEQRLEQLGTELRAIEAALSQPELYQEGDKDALRQQLLTQARLKEELERVEAAWLSLADQLESLSATN
jgi:ATP-binding cassette subfamily F protein 3